MYSKKIKLHQRQELWEQGQLRTIALDVTPLCNMNCDRCYAYTFRKSKPINLKILKKALDEAYEMGVHHYILQGGEPTYDFKRLKEIIKICHPDETYINVVTNGWNIFLDKIKQLKALEVDKITFSLDSGIKEEHDKNRMKDSFDRVMKGIDNTIAEGLSVSISTVITNENLYSEGFNKLLELVESKEIRLDIQIAMPVGRWDGNMRYLVTPEDSRYVKKLQMEYPILSNGQKMINRDLFNYGGSDHCPAGTEFLAIATNGEVLPCNFLQFTLGNIKNKSLTEMRDRLLQIKWFDGKHPNCLCGENMDFIEKYILPNTNKQKPLCAFKYFVEEDD